MVAAYPIEKERGLWYQEATINGKEMPTMPHKESAASRWETYLKPLLPRDSGRAIDLGCSAGFYCRELVDLGYKATGMDLHIGKALHWETQHPKGISYLSGDITKWDFPYANLALAACVLYWQDEYELESMVERLRHRVAHVIVMNRINMHESHTSCGELSHMKNVFRLWKQGETITKDKHYSTIFHSNKIYPARTWKLDLMSIRSKEFRYGFMDLIKLVCEGKPFKREANGYYKYLHERAIGYKFLEAISLIMSVRDNGILVPIKVCNGLVIDGAHRILLAKHFGFPYMLCEDTAVG